MTQLLAITFFILWAVLAVCLWVGVEDWRRYDFELSVLRILKAFFGSCFFTTLAAVVLMIGSLALNIEVRW